MQLLIKEGLSYTLPFMGSQPVTGIKLWAATYSNGRLALRLTAPMEEDENIDEPFATATVNLIEQDCPRGEIWVKDWSENEGMVEWLIENQVIEDGATASAPSGYIVAHRYKLTPQFVATMIAVGLPKRICGVPS